jgi:hypothetical protein
MQQSEYEYAQNILTLLATEATAMMEDEWLEAFWCDECQETQWYHVKKIVSDTQGKSARISYEISVVSRSDFWQSTSVISPLESLLR